MLNYNGYSTRSPECKTVGIRERVRALLERWFPGKPDEVAPEVDPQLKAKQQAWEEAKRRSDAEAENFRTTLTRVNEAWDKSKLADKNNNQAG